MKPLFIISLLFGVIFVNAQTLTIKNQYDKGIDAFVRKTSWEPFILNDSVKIYVSATKYLARYEFEDVLFLNFRISVNFGIFQLSNDVNPVDVEDSSGNGILIHYNSDDSSCLGCGAVNSITRNMQGLEMNVLMDTLYTNYFQKSAISKMHLYITNANMKYVTIEENISGKSKKVIANEMKLVNTVSRLELFKGKKIPDIPVINEMKN